MRDDEVYKPRVKSSNEIHLLQRTYLVQSSLSTAIGRVV